VHLGSGAHLRIVPLEQATEQRGKAKLAKKEAGDVREGLLEYCHLCLHYRLQAWEMTPFSLAPALQCYL
jgi:hypothetical protein